MNTSAVKRLWLACLAALTALSLCCVPRAYAEQAATEHHYLGFASDLHDTEGALEGAFGSFPNNPEYISFIGDMVGARGGDAPAYNTSDLLAKILAIDTCANIKADGSNISVVWADHDAGANDDAGIMVGVGDPAGYLSEQVYAGKNEGGSTAYYIYVVGFYDMLKGGSVSQQAAENFKTWVAEKDVTVPVIVMCHAPLVAKRGDNHGAAIWSEALNYAATGVADITSEDDTDIPLIRNIVFLSGHNHTVDANEYVNEVGTVLNVQGESSTEDTRIYYTAITPGYLKTSGSATLLDISKDTLTFTKYNKDGETDLGVTAAGEAVASPLVIERIQWGEPSYTWSDDLSTVTATRALKNNPSYKQAEAVNTTKIISKQATCTEKGQTTYTAEFDNEAFETQTKTRIDIAALGHSWGEWKVTKAPTEAAEGEEARVCSRCGEVETRTVPKLQPETAEIVTPRTGTTESKKAGSSSGTIPATSDPISDIAPAEILLVLALLFLAMLPVASNANRGIVQHSRRQ